MDERYDRQDTQRNTNSVLTGIALLIASLALVLSWVAYNRTGEDLENKINEQVNSAANASQDAAQSAVDSVESAVDTGQDGVDDGTN